MRLMLSVVIGFVMSDAIVAQMRSEFDAASVKPNRSGESRSYYSGLGAHPLNGEIISFKSHIALTNVDLEGVIRRAYGIPPARRWMLVGGTPATLSSRFDIAAAVPDGATTAQVVEMLRSLLADRFKLRLHQEAREMPVYGVTVARPGRLGPALIPTAVNCVDFITARTANPALVEPVAKDGQPLCLHSDGVTPINLSSASPIAALLLRAGGFVDRPLVDATGLDGSFEWNLTFSLVDSPNPTAPLLPDAFREQLGLKLEPRVAPVDVWVIDSVEMPTAD